jgi:hypothetical protein
MLTHLASVAKQIVDETDFGLGLVMRFADWKEDLQRERREDWSTSWRMGRPKQFCDLKQVETVPVDSGVAMDHRMNALGSAGTKRR